MTVGDIVTVFIEGMTRELNVITVEDEPGYPYVIYRLMKSGAVHLLYVRRGFSLPERPLDISGHVILFEDEIIGNDYYVMINKDCVLPL